MRQNTRAYCKFLTSRNLIQYRVNLWAYGKRGESLNVKRLSQDKPNSQEWYKNHFTHLRKCGSLRLTAVEGTRNDDDFDSSSVQQMSTTPLTNPLPPYQKLALRFHETLVHATDRRWHTSATFKLTE